MEKRWAELVDEYLDGLCRQDVGAHESADWRGACLSKMRESEGYSQREEPRLEGRETEPRTLRFSLVAHQGKRRLAQRSALASF